MGVIGLVLFFGPFNHISWIQYLKVMVKSLDGKGKIYQFTNWNAESSGM